jgi:hypothetical protein
VGTTMGNRSSSPASATAPQEHASTWLSRASRNSSRSDNRRSVKLAAPVRIWWPFVAAQFLPVGSRWSDASRSLLS